MKWRKASELLPDENEPMVYRNSLTKKPIPYRKVSFSESFGNKWIRFYLTVSDITNVTVENVEWLDESSTSVDEVNREMKEAIETLLTGIEYFASEHSAVYAIATPDIIMLKDAVLSLPQSSTEEEKDLWLDLITEVEMNEFLSTKYKEVIDKLQSTYKISKR